MNKSPALLAFVIFIMFISLCSGSSYYAEYSQIGGKVVIKETIDNLQISNYVSKEQIENKIGGYYFVEKIIFNQSYDKAEISLILDEGVIIETSKIFPDNYEISSDGKSIIIIWTFNNIQNNQKKAFFLELKNTTSNNIYPTLIIMALLLSVYLYYSKIKKTPIKKIKPISKIIKKQKQKTDYDYLLDTEKRVIEELKKADRNELWQKQIQTATGYSKAKVSRLIRNLEARNLVTKIPFGNTNKVRLR